MRGKRILNLIIAILLLLVTLSGCGSSVNVKISEMSLEELEKCVLLCDYKDLKFTLDDESKEQVLISHIVANSSIRKYPKGTVKYYVEQRQKQYRYYAEQEGMKYEELLDKLGEDNITINAEAKRIVKKDMIFELIRKREGITLSDDEKSAFFDRYVKKYAEQYEFSEEYVREELSDFVYDSMLYDKTVEFLIIHNSFEQDSTEQNQQTE